MCEKLIRLIKNILHSFHLFYIVSISCREEKWRKYEDSGSNIVLIRSRCKRRCTCWVSSMKKFNISKYITSSSRRRSAIQNSIIWYAAKSGEKAAMGWKWFLGWTPRWGSIDEGAAVTDGMSRTDVGIIHYDWPTGFLYASSSSNKRSFFFKSIVSIDTSRYFFTLILDRYCYTEKYTNKHDLW